MQFLRNQEIKNDIVIFSVLSVLMGILAGAVSGTGTGIAVFWLVLACLIVHLWREKKRYQRIARMGDEIDRLLHGEYVELLKDCEEGELAILSSQMNKMIRRLKEQAEKEQDAKVFLSDAMADISHQIKTPLTSMNLLLSLLKEADVSGERKNELTRELSKLTAKIEWLVYALLRIAKLDAGTVELKRERIRMKDLIGRAGESIAIPMELKGIRLEYRIEENAQMICDADWMEEAVTNVMKNCMEHTGQGGLIEVTAEENELYSSILIQDNGPGIDPEDLPHIFERFYKGKYSGKDSAGIGLALAEKIIRSQNGTVNAGNRKDAEGAWFQIRIYKKVI